MIKERPLTSYLLYQTLRLKIIYSVSLQYAGHANIQGAFKNAILASKTQKMSIFGGHPVHMIENLQLQF